MNSIAIIKTWPQTPARYVAGGIRYTEEDTGEWVEIHPNVTLGDGCKLGYWCKLGDGCKLGDECTLGYRCKLGDGCKLGDRCKLGNWCVLGGGCKLGDECTIGNSCTLDDECWLGDWCSIGYGCNLGRCKLGNGCTIGNKCKLGDGCVFGNLCKLGDGCKLCDGSKFKETPVYLWPRGGLWPVYVSDPDKQMIGIGCEIHRADFWLEGGADKVREKHGCQHTKDTYDAAIRFVCEQMGWLNKESNQ